MPLAKMMMAPVVIEVAVFSIGGIKLERLLPSVKKCQILTFKVNFIVKNLSRFFFIKEFQFRCTIFGIDIF